MNNVILAGRLGADPEIKTFQDGSKIAILSVATNYKYKENDQWQDGTDWHRVIAKGAAASFAEYLSKGQFVALQGQLKTRKYESNGTKYVTEVITKKIEASKQENTTGNQQENYASQSQARPLNPEPNEDLPF
ncbi:MAG: single-stranded DNA-binding protein [Bacteroidota bacterium]